MRVIQRTGRTVYVPDQRCGLTVLRTIVRENGNGFLTDCRRFWSHGGELMVEGEDAIDLASN